MVYVEVGIVLLIFAEFCGQLAMISSDILEKFGKFAARLSGKNPAILVELDFSFHLFRTERNLTKVDYLEI